MTGVAFPLRSNPAAVKFMGEPRLMNCYPEEIGQEERSPVGFLAIPGQKQFASIDGVPSRGAIYLPELGAAYSIHGLTVYKIASDGTSSALAGFVAGANPVVMERGPKRFMQSVVTISIASPGIVSWMNHRLPAGTPFQFSTDGDLPTGIVANTTYYVLASGLTQNSFKFAATAGGSAINTSGTQDGTHTATRTTPTYQIGIVSDAASYCIEDDQLITLILPPDDEAANSLTMLANRWVFSFPSGKNYYSELNDITDVDALNFFTAESRPDGMVRAIASGGDLCLLGTETGEIYQPSGDADEPFTPLSGTFVPKGCAARDSATIFDNAVHWLGNDGVVYRLSGYAAQRVSTHSVERAIGKVSDKTTIAAYVDIGAGHAFYILTCPQWTWAFDAATQEWCERTSYQRANWNAWPYLSAFGKRLVGSVDTGIFSELSDDYLDENGLPIRVHLTLPDIPGQLIFNRLEIDLATGAGLGASPGTDGYDPKLMLRWSDDGGNTWSNERTRPVGKQGTWATVVAFDRLGMTRTIRGRRFDIAMSEPVRKAFMLGDVQVEAVA